MSSQDNATGPAQPLPYTNSPPPSNSPPPPPPTQSSPAPLGRGVPPAPHPPLCRPQNAGDDTCQFVCQFEAAQVFFFKKSQGTLAVFVPKKYSGFFKLFFCSLCTLVLATKSTLALDHDKKV